MTPHHTTSLVQLLQVQGAAQAGVSAVGAAAGQALGLLPLLGLCRPLGLLHQEGAPPQAPEAWGSLTRPFLLSSCRAALVAAAPSAAVQGVLQLGVMLLQRRYMLSWLACPVRLQGCL